MTKQEYQALAAHTEVLLVDIRELGEVLVDPSPAGAVNVPMSRLAAAVAAGELPKDATIVTLCQSGGRCFPVNAFLAAQGYGVEQIDGGLDGWKRM